MRAVNCCYLAPRGCPRSGSSLRPAFRGPAVQSRTGTRLRSNSMCPWRHSSTWILPYNVSSPKPSCAKRRTVRFQHRRAPARTLYWRSGGLFWSAAAGALAWRVMRHERHGDDVALGRPPLFEEASATLLAVVSRAPFSLTARELAPSIVDTRPRSADLRSLLPSPGCRPPSSPSARTHVASGVSVDAGSRSAGPPMLCWYLWPASRTRRRRVSSRHDDEQ